MRIHGSSPRGRGTRRPAQRVGGEPRFIPAWAGDTERRVCRHCHRSVHPRVGGGHQPRREARGITSGSSPRGRGTPPPPRPRPWRRRFIPAWAGDTTARWSRHCARPVHPRVGGGHIAASSSRCAWSGSSPRGRGTRDAIRPWSCCGRFIPAWAGDTPMPRLHQPARPVHPRVGGGHSFYKLFKELAFFKL